MSWNRVYELLPVNEENNCNNYSALSTMSADHVKERWILSTR